MYQIQPSGTRSSVGKLFDATMDDIEVRGQKPRSIFLAVQGGSAVVRIRVGEGEGGAEITRSITLTPRGAWLSIAGWSIVTIEVTALSAGAIVTYCWLTVCAPTFERAARSYQTLAAGTASVVIPDGAVGVTPDRAEAGASWETVDGTGTYTIPAILTAGVETTCRGRRLLFAAPLGSALTLAWEIATW